MSQDIPTPEYSKLIVKDYGKLKDKDGKYLYIIWEKGTKDYKIGITNFPKERLRNLQQGNSNELILKRVYKGKDAIEVEGQLLTEIEAAGIGTKKQGRWLEIPDRQRLYNLVSSKEGTDFKEVSDEEYEQMQTD